MAVVASLPFPRLGRQTVNEITFLTDDALASSVGVFAGFTLRGGGVSSAPYDSLNLADHVQDDIDAVHRNRQLLLSALGFPRARLLVPHQVHGTNLVTVADNQEASWQQAVELSRAGADGLLIGARQVAALLCFADCLPALIVSPTGRFAVVHAGWRGALAGIVGRTIQEMVRQDARAGYDGGAPTYNLYLGPYIHSECFEVSTEIAHHFKEIFGSAAALDDRHVNLSAAVQADARATGVDPERVIDAGICTVCSHDQVFSYRASGGVCGRHGAFGIRR